MLSNVSHVIIIHINVYYLGPNLKVVATMSVGKDHINERECQRRGIVVANTPDVASDSAADLSVALILMTTRRLVEGEFINCIFPCHFFVY